MKKFYIRFLIGQMCDMGPKSGTSSDQEELQEVLSGSWQSTTPSCKPMTHDKIYYFLPYWDDKPCLHVRSIWPDYRRRMYNSNIISKISDKLVSRGGEKMKFRNCLFICLFVFGTGRRIIGGSIAYRRLLRGENFKIHVRRIK